MPCVIQEQIWKSCRGNPTAKASGTDCRHIVKMLGLQVLEESAQILYTMLPLRSHSLETKRDRMVILVSQLVREIVEFIFVLLERLVNTQSGCRVFLSCRRSRNHDAARFMVHLVLCFEKQVEVLQGILYDTFLRRSFYYSSTCHGLREETVGVWLHGEVCAHDLHFFGLQEHFVRTGRF